MSYFDDASLVMIPSGYKDQKVYSVKPLDGSGDLTFSRASSATRVASNGLIEKVRTNLLLQSNTFSSVSWTNNNATLTSGQADPFGGSNAWKMEATISTQSDLRQTVSGAAGYSIYVKAGNYNFFSLWTGAAGIAFDLSAGTAGAGGTITSVGSGWYRCSVATSTTGSVTLIPFFSANAGDFVYIAFAQAEPTDVPTDYIATTSAAVSVGPVSGLPRLDYLNSTCPRLLLEPQRSNLMLYSEQFNNAAWSKNATTITANAATSPDGYTNADKLIVDNGASLSSISNYALQSITKAASAIQYTYSAFAKQGGLNRVIIVAQGASFANNASATFSLVNGTITTAAVSVGDFTGASASVSDYGNGWYRCTLVFTTNTDTDLIIRNIPTDSTLTTGNGTNGILIYGAQLEAGAYATSYIPTLGTSVTRVADAASKTGISSLIGQTEGTIFFEADVTNSFGIQLGNSTSSNDYVNSIQIAISASSTNAGCHVGGVSQMNFGGAGRTGVQKIALAYKQNDFVLYANGTQLTTDTSASVPAMAAIIYNHVDLGTQNGKVAQTLLFKTRLTNAQLAELTTL